MIDWTPTIQQCAPEVHLSTMQAIIRTESGFNPIAININGGTRLPRQPRSKAEAISWARWLITRGYSVDLGLMQINSANLPRLGLDAESIFDPCRNLQAGASILVNNYSRAARQSDNSRSALLKAISAYNTGNFKGGFRNGYVSRVIQAPAVVPSDDQNAPPLFAARPAQQKAVAYRQKSRTNTGQQTVAYRPRSEKNVANRATSYGERNYTSSMNSGSTVKGW
jgi:type IV secretion system protein VirB1